MSLDVSIPRVVDIPDSFPSGGEWYVRVNRRATAWLAARNAGRNLRLEPSTLVTREMTDQEREARRQRLADRNGTQAKRPAVYRMRRSSAEAYRLQPEVPKPQTPPNPPRAAPAHSVHSPSRCEGFQAWGTQAPRVRDREPRPDHRGMAGRCLTTDH